MAVNTKVIKTKEPALKRFLGSLAKFFKDLKAETKRITWPSKEDTKKAVIAAFVFSFLLMAYISLLDAGFGKLYNYFFAVK